MVLVPVREINATTPFEPESNWKCPDPVRDFPDLRGRRAKRFRADREWKDLGLKENGAGWMRGDAKVTGVAISTLSAR